MTFEKIHDFGNHIRITIPGGYCLIKDDDEIRKIRKCMKEAERLVNKGIIEYDDIAGYVEYELASELGLD